MEMNGNMPWGDKGTLGGRRNKGEQFILERFKDK